MKILVTTFISSVLTLVFCAYGIGHTKTIIFCFEKKGFLKRVFSGIKDLLGFYRADLKEAEE